MAVIRLVETGIPGLNEIPGDGILESVIVESEHGKLFLLWFG